MALAFKSATGSNGISGSVYWSDPDYYVDGVGSSVLLDDARTPNCSINLPTARIRPAPWQSGGRLTDAFPEPIGFIIGA